MNKENNNKSLMQLALGKQWHKLPKALQNHYGSNEQGVNRAQGKLDISYPWFMQWPLTVMRLFGALVNKRGKGLNTEVSKSMINGQQFWHRVIRFPDGRSLNFTSTITLNNKGDFIEYVNPFLGLKMRAFVENQQLRYESKGYVLKLGKAIIPIPEWLALGHASIIESEFDETDSQTFVMDFRIKHPLFGEVFCYKGRFKTEL